jgi:hypothetical protein
VTPESEEESEADRGARRSRWAWVTAVLCVLVFVIAAGETMRLAVRGLDRFDVRSPTVGLNLVPVLFTGLEALAAPREDPQTHRVAFLGDSISISVRGGALSTPRALRSRLEDGVELHSLAALGTGPFDHYFLVDEIVEARPDQVVVAFSLQSFGAVFRSLSRERLSGWVAPERLASVALGPIHWIGLTVDELLLNRGIVGVRGAEMWRQLLVQQARLGAARDELASWLSARLGGSGHQAFEMASFANERRRTRMEGDRDRYAADAERNHYGPLLQRLDGDHPVLVVLGRTLSRLNEAGIPVLVYVNPVNVEHLAALGLLEDGSLDESLATIEAVVRRSGAGYLDLHDLLPDAAFRDAAGHLGTPEDPESTDRLAGKVAPRIEAVRAAARTGSR